MHSTVYEPKKSVMMQCNPDLYFEKYMPPPTPPFDCDETRRLLKVCYQELVGGQDFVILSFREGEQAAL